MRIADILQLADSIAFFKLPDYRSQSFQSGVGGLLALYFNKLPGCPLPDLHYNAKLCGTHSRKTPALVVLKSQVVGTWSTNRLI